MTISRKSSFVVAILMITAFSTELSASEKKDGRSIAKKIFDSKSDEYKILLNASRYGAIFSPLLFARGITQYFIGRKLSQPKPTLTPQSLKSRGLVNTTMGFAAMIPYAIFYYNLAHEINQEKLARQSALGNSPSLLSLENNGKTSGEND